MDIILSNTTDKPIYQQIIEQIEAHILSGELARRSAPVYAHACRTAEDKRYHNKTRL